jgi:hypothetical protein
VFITLPGNDLQTRIMFNQGGSMPELSFNAKLEETLLAYAENKSLIVATHIGSRKGPKSRMTTVLSDLSQLGVGTNIADAEITESQIVTDYVMHPDACTVINNAVYRIFEKAFQPNTKDTTFHVFGICDSGVNRSALQVICEVHSLCPFASIAELKEFLITVRKSFPSGFLNHRQVIRFALLWTCLLKRPTNQVECDAFEKVVEELLFAEERVSRRRQM